MFQLIAVLMTALLPPLAGDSPCEAKPFLVVGLLYKALEYVSVPIRVIRFRDGDH